MSKETKNPLTRSSGLPSNLMLTLAVVLVAVVVIGGVFLFRGGDGGNGGGQQAQGGNVVAEELLRKPDSHTLLEADSQVTVVEFLDYQCPACYAYYRDIISGVEGDYEGRITFVTRNFPLQMHALAVPAARAAEAAALQGRYSEMYHALFDNYEDWAINEAGDATSEDLARAESLFDQYARELGLDLDQFHQDMNSEEVTQRIEADRADGEAAGVNSTPTFFINGEQFTPSGDTVDEVDEQFRTRLDEALGES